MIKPFCLYVAVPLVYLCWRRFGRRFVIRPVLWFYAVLVIIPTIAWYVHAFHLWTVYGNTFGIFGGRIRGVYLGADTPGAALLLRTLGWRLLWEIATPPGLVLLAACFFVRPPSRNYVFHWWTLAFLATVPLVPAGHYGHNYYQLPLVLTAAPAMAYGLVRLVDLGTISWKGAALMCVAVLACCAWALRPMIATSPELRQRIAFGKRVTRAVPDDALVVFSYPLDYKPSWYSHRTLDGDLIAGDPTDFYNSHRRGWSLLASQTSPEMLRKLEKHHAQYFATFYPKYLYQQQPEIKSYLETHALPVDITGRWIIYHLPEPGAPSASLGGN
jgi:hypothetical protein